MTHHLDQRVSLDNTWTWFQVQREMATKSGNHRALIPTLVLFTFFDVQVWWCLESLLGIFYYDCWDSEAWLSFSPRSTLNSGPKVLLEFIAGWYFPPYIIRFSINVFYMIFGTHNHWFQWFSIFVHHWPNAGIVTSLWEASARQNGWIFGETPNGHLTPPPSAGKSDNFPRSRNLFPQKVRKF